MAAVASPSALAAAPSAYRRWEPLAKILYGFCISPFAPELEQLELPAELLDEGSHASLAAIQAHLIGLEVGDEVYVFEQLGHSDVAWFRGYVVSSTRVPMPATSTSSRSEYSTFGSQARGGAALVEEPQVYVGIFPAVHVHIREHLDDAELRLQEVHARAVEQGVVGATAPPPGSKLAGQKHMETLHEEDEGAASAPNSPIGPAQAPAQANRSPFRLQEPLDAPGEAEVERPPPPLPSLKCGDETASGSDEPLVDEIACALREWSSLMYVYLGRRDYVLFNAVKEHIEVLHAARRQLLAQTLSVEEVAKLRRECVARLVKGNVAQGLDVIVRHPGRGGLVDVDFTGKESDPESWVSGIRLFALQASLAYVDQLDAASSGGSAQGGLEISASNAFGITAPSTTSAGVLGAPSSFAGALSVTGKRSAGNRQSTMSGPPRARASLLDPGRLDEQVESGVKVSALLQLARL
jgi:dedicator of cytokinesis protein 3